MANEMTATNGAGRSLLRKREPPEGAAFPAGGAVKKMRVNLEPAGAALAGSVIPPPATPTRSGQSVTLAQKSDGPTGTYM